MISVLAFLGEESAFQALRVCLTTFGSGGATTFRGPNMNLVEHDERKAAANFFLSAHGKALNTEL